MIIKNYRSKYDHDNFHKYCNLIQEKKKLVLKSILVGLSFTFNVTMNNQQLNNVAPTQRL